MTIATFPRAPSSGSPSTAATAATAAATLNRITALENASPVDLSGLATVASTEALAARVVELEADTPAPRALYVTSSVSDRTALIPAPVDEGTLATIVGGNWMQRRGGVWVTISKAEALGLAGQVAAFSDNVDDAAAKLHISTPGREWAYGKVSGTGFVSAS